MRDQNAMAVVIVVLLAVIGLLAYERHNYQAQTPGQKIGRAIDDASNAAHDLANDMKHDFRR